MKPEIIRDYINDKTPAIFDCRTAKRITWTIMDLSVVYFGIALALHLLA